MVRLQAYGPKGALLSDVRYANWQAVSAGSAEEYPMSIRIERPRDEYRLDLAIGKIALNEPLDADRFKLEAPAGAEVVHVGENSEEKRP
jgi:outer membrane lipoprotein-sorting protein